MYIRYLGVPIGHILHYTARRKPPAVHKCWCNRCFSNCIDGYINHSPHALGVLLAEAEEVYLANRNQRWKDLEFSMHLREKKLILNLLQRQLFENPKGNIERTTRMVVEETLTSWSAPFLVPPMPLDITSVVEVLAIIHGNISAHRFYSEESKLKLIKKKKVHKHKIAIPNRQFCKHKLVPKETQNPTSTSLKNYFKDPNF